MKNVKVKNENASVHIKSRTPIMKSGEESNDIIVNDIRSFLVPVHRRCPGKGQC